MDVEVEHYIRKHYPTLDQLVEQTGVADAAILELVECACIPRHSYEIVETSDRGYRTNGKSCVTIEIPHEGYLALSGHDWECNRGYRKSYASRSQCLRTATSPLRDATGSAIGVTRRALLCA